MPFARHRARTSAPASVVWKLLLDKIEHPQRYVPGIMRAEIVSRHGATAVERVMQGDGEPIHELIGWEPNSMAVIFKLINHPRYSGFVTNIVLPATSGCELDFTMNWQPHHGSAVSTVDNVDWEASIREAVEHTISVAETNDR